MRNPRNPVTTRTCTVDCARTTGVSYLDAEDGEATLGISVAPHAATALAWPCTTSATIAGIATSTATRPRRASGLLHQRRVQGRGPRYRQQVHSLRLRRASARRSPSAVATIAAAPLQPNAEWGPREPDGATQSAGENTTTASAHANMRRSRPRRRSTVPSATCCCRELIRNAESNAPAADRGLTQNQAQTLTSCLAAPRIAPVRRPVRQVSWCSRTLLMAVGAARAASRRAEPARRALPAGRRVLQARDV